MNYVNPPEVATGLQKCEFGCHCCCGIVVSCFRVRLQGSCSEKPRGAASSHSEHREVSNGTAWRTKNKLPMHPCPQRARTGIHGSACYYPWAK